MCGILGYSGSFSPSLLPRANRLQAHRGPDDEGIYVDEKMGIGLGHVRLSIIDLSPHGHQPMVARGGDLCLVFNGEMSFRVADIDSAASPTRRCFFGCTRPTANRCSAA